MRERAKFYLDVIERSGFTFVQGYAAAFAVDGFVGRMLDMDGLKLSPKAKLAIGIVAGIFSVFKGVIAPLLPWSKPNTASTLPAESEPT